MEQGPTAYTPLVSGQLVSITFNKELLSNVGFATAGKRENYDIFYEKIRLSSWPGWNDFFGSTIQVQEGDIAIIVEKMGRPLQICSGPEGAIYDVYEILINDKVCQAFRCHLIPLAHRPLHLTE